MLMFPVLFSVATRWPLMAVRVALAMLVLSLLTPVFGPALADKFYAVGMALLMLAAVLDTARDRWQRQLPYRSYLILCSLALAGALWKTFSS